MADNVSEGEIKKKIEIILSEDVLFAYVRLNMTQNELEGYPKEKLVADILRELKSKGVVFGVKGEFLPEGFEPYKDYMVAEGMEPIDGEDSKINMYALNTGKLVIKESEKADFYHLQPMNRVKSGDWLGERINATDGIPGKSVTGQEILQKKGIDYPLCYDKKTVVEVSMFQKTTLYAKTDGVVHYNEKSIFVSNHLEIDGDVGYGTGSIEVDGFVTVKGSVCDGFSIVATKDIEILGETGIGNVKKIESKYGSIFIKGGVASKDGSEIIAQKDVYAKFVENTKVICGGEAHIGFYSINSNVSAKEVIFDSMKGKILGGRIIAEMKVSAPFIGSESEKKTIVEVRGFDRNKLEENRVLIESKIEKLKNSKKSLEEAADFKEKISEGRNSCDVLNKLFNIEEELSGLEYERKYLSTALKIKASGEIQVLKKIFAGVQITINGKTLEIRNSELAGSYFVQNDEINKT